MNSLETIAQISEERQAKQSAAVLAFLSEVLADGEIAVPVLEAQARATGLLGKEQQITNSKLFRKSKRELGIRSRRTGFGPNGHWLWRLGAVPDVKAESIAPLVPSGPGTEDTYAVDHSRSRQPAEKDDRARSVQPDEVPAEWINGLSLLESGSKPRDVAGLQWDQFLRGCRWFLRPPEHWAARAYQLGWSTSDLFACCPVRPLDYLASAGLIWRLRGGRLKMLSSHSAIISSMDGREYMFDRHHRRPTALATTLPWMLP